MVFSSRSHLPLRAVGLRLCLFESRLSIRHDQHVEASSFEERSQAIDDIRIVIGEQNGRVLAGHRSGFRKGPGLCDQAHYPGRSAAYCTKEKVDMIVSNTADSATLSNGVGGVA